MQLAETIPEVTEADIARLVGDVMRKELKLTQKSKQ